MNIRAPILVVGLAVAVLTQRSPGQPSNPWRVFRNTDGLAETACVSVSIGASGNILLGHADRSRLSVLDGYDARAIPVPVTRSRVLETSSGQLWTVTPAGLAQFRDNAWVEHPVPELAAYFRDHPNAPVGLLPVVQGRLLILLPERLLRAEVEESGQAQLTLVLQAAETKVGNFVTMSRAADGGLWIAGSKGLARFAAPVRTLTAGAECRQFLPPVAAGLENFRTFYESADSRVVALADTPAGKAVATFDGTNWTSQPLRLDALLFAWRSGPDTFVATSESVFKLENGVSPPVPVEASFVRRIFDVAVEPGGAVCLATSEGLLRHAPSLWQKPDPQETVPEGEPGRRNRKSPSPPANVVEGVPGQILGASQWRAWLLGRNGDLWLGGTHGVAWRHEGSWKLFASTNRFGPEDVLAFAESPEGRVWCATPNTVWQFDGKDWLVLRAGFEHLNAIHCTAEGTLWVATDRSLFRHLRGTWLVNSTEDGLGANTIWDVREDERGTIWAVTPAGAFRFTPAADQDPPRTYIRAGKDSKLSFREGALVTLAFEGKDKWKLTAARRLLFSYRLDEHDWTSFQEQTEFSAIDLAPGKHYFQARAIDSNGNIDPNPTRVEFLVMVPWYRETRLVLVLSVALAVAVSFAALAMNRHRRLRLSYAEVEQKVAERTRELELAGRELLHSQKMNALGTLAAGIAHDFNNILSIIKGSAQIIEDNPDDPEKIRTRLDRIKTVVQQGAGIVEAMLGFSRGSGDQTGPCDLNAAVDDTVKLLGDRFLREVEVRIEREMDLPQPVVPREFVQQVLLNFIFNAAEAMTGHKKIVISTKKLAGPPSAEVLAPAPAPRYASVAVRDIGSGIAPENLPRIFEPFFTTKGLSARRGTGLGLSMVYELARKMDAGLAVETVVGAGSTFTLILPVKEP